MNNIDKTTHLPELFKTIDWEGENTLGYKLRQIIFGCVQSAVGARAEVKFADVKIEHPSIENYGDYSTNIALIFAGRLGMKPRDLAEKIAEELNKYIKEYQSRTPLTDSLSHQDEKKSHIITREEPKVAGQVLKSALVAGPGFVNLTIRSDYLSSLLDRVIGKENGSTTTFLKDKKIMVEFAHPNTHKEFHIGHLRNISIGESLVRMLTANGAQLFRANYEGDVGLHVAKAIWGVQRKILAKGRSSSGRKKILDDLRKLNPANKAKFLGEGYALGSKMYDESETVKKEIIELNKAIYKDPKKVELWEETRRWSLEYFDTLYKRLGTHFDRLFFESEVEAKGRQIVKDNVATGIFIKDKDGSIYFPGEKYGLNNCVFVTRENYATYEGKEVALEELEFNTFPFDVDIHVVAHEQQNFFQIAFKALELLSPIQKGRQYHLVYGMVNLKGAKLSSRTGQVVTADWLIDQAKEKVKKIMEQTSRKDTSVEETEEIAEKVAVAAVKYSMLKVNPRMDIAFDIEESVSFEGDSGPYLMYTYARCRSVLRKAKGQRITYQVSRIKYENKKDIPNTKYVIPNTIEPNNEELILLRTLYKFSEVVTDAARNLSPNLLCSFLFDLSQKYNLFYNKHSILNPDNKEQRTDNKKENIQPTTHNLPAQAGPQPTTHFRLALTSAISIILKRGLYLLGIDIVERM